MNTFSTRASKFLWMEERNSEPTEQLTNNRSSDSSTSDCAKQMANCCRVRGGSSNGSIDFPNKITLNQLSGENMGDFLEAVVNESLFVTCISC